MLLKQYRLVRWEKKQEAKVLHTPFFTLRVAPNTFLYSRFGFVVSKKIDKRAVVRNNTKRKVRSCIEAMQKDIKPGLDMFFFLKKAAVDEERSEIDKRIQALFTQEKFLQ